MTDTKSVCRVRGGSSNKYLDESRKVEDFLRFIEPKYNKAIRKLRAGQIDRECIFVLAGFVAYVASCSPTGMRLFTPPLQEMLKKTAILADQHGLIPPPPSGIGFGSLTELVDAGKLKFVVDSKYPQAIGISQIVERTASFGNFAWEILTNPFSYLPFLTSDYPVAIERTNDARIRNRIVPLTPSLAVRIIPRLRSERKKPNLSFPDFRWKPAVLSENEVHHINSLIVRCAEDLVFYSLETPWVRELVKANARFRIVNKVIEWGPFSVWSMEIEPLSE